MKERKPGRGGARIGAGNKPGLTRVVEKRKQYPLTILPSIIEPFKEQYGRGWSRKLEEMIKDNLRASAPSNRK